MWAFARNGSESAVGLTLGVAGAHAGFLWLMELAGDKAKADAVPGVISSDAAVAALGSSLAALVLVGILSAAAGQQRSEKASESSRIRLVARIASGLALAGVIIASVQGVATSGDKPALDVVLQGTGVCVALLVDRVLRLALRPSSWIRLWSASAAIVAAALVADGLEWSVSAGSVGAFALCLFVRLVLISLFGRGRSDRMAYYRAEQMSAAGACILYFSWLLVVAPGSVDRGLGVIALPFFAGAFLAGQGLFSTLIKLLDRDNTTCSFLSQLGAGAGILLAQVVIMATGHEDGGSSLLEHVLPVGILLVGYWLAYRVDRRAAAK